MAAPEGIVWGGLVNSAYRIGIYVSKNSSATQTAVTIQTWIWSKWSLDDKTNKYYFDNGATSATTLSKENIAISHTVASGSGWSTRNQSQLASHSYVYNHGTSVQTISCAAKITPIGSSDVSLYASTSYSIPALDKYTVSYNANGGTGAPSSQTKWHSITLTLSSTVPTRTGYTFVGWARSSSSTTADYAAGAFYGYNEDTVLYAVWKAITYSVTYNANGGSNAPSAQTKIYNVALTITTSKPTRTNYNFLGWGTSASATTVSYTAGSSYTANAAITLYAVWELAYTAPRITSVSVFRSESSGTASDTGTYITTKFSWATDHSVSSVKILWGVSGETASTIVAISASGTSGSVNKTFGDGNVSIENAYTVKIEVTDSGGTTTKTYTVPGAAYPIDVLRGGRGVAIGKPAKNVGFEIAMDTNVEKTFAVHEVITNPISSVDDDTVENWIKRGATLLYNGKTEQLVDQIGQWGYILNLTGYSTNLHQLWFSQPNGDLAHRGGNHNGWSGTWKILLDSSNCGAYCLPIIGGTTTGYVKLGNTINAIGQIRQHTDYIGFFPSVTDAQNNTNRRGWTGYNSTANYSVVNNSSGSNITNVAWTVSSDERLKKAVEDVPDVFLDIWSELQPKIFKWDDINSANTKYHFGLIAQDVIAAFESRGLDYREYGFVNSFTLPDDDTEYFGIAYDEYHILTSSVLRKTNARLEDLQRQIDALRISIETSKG